MKILLLFADATGVSLGEVVTIVGLVAAPLTGALVALWRLDRAGLVAVCAERAAALKAAAQEETRLADANDKLTDRIEVLAVELARANARLERYEPVDGGRASRPSFPQLPPLPPPPPSTSRPPHGDPNR